MTTAAGTHVALFGELSHFYSHPLSLFYENLVVGGRDLVVPPVKGLSSILLAQGIPQGDSLQTWERESAHTQEQLEHLLPAMANPATILVIGHAVSEQKGERRRARRFLRTLVSGIRSHARNLQGKEVSANGIEVPPSADQQIIARRLIRFLNRVPLAANNNVIQYEAITEQPIKLALTAHEL